MVDVHSHVLFGIDDGAETIEDSLNILIRAEKAGIKKMIATPHFSIGDEVDRFLQKRDAHFKELEKAVLDKGIEVELKCGAEVYITDEIYNEARLGELTLGNSNVLLSEFKYHGLKPETMLDYVDEIMSHGLKVLIAHPERYSYLRNRMLVNALVSRGVLFQVNAISLFEENEEGDFARMLVRCGVASIIGSDIHHVPSGRMDAVKILVKNHEIDEIMFDNPDLIFENSKELDNIEAELL